MTRETHVEPEPTGRTKLKHGPVPTLRKSLKLFSLDSSLLALSLSATEQNSFFDWQVSMPRDSGLASCRLHHGRHCIFVTDAHRGSLSDETPYRYSRVRSCTRESCLQLQVCQRQRTNAPPVEHCQPRLLRYEWGN